MLNLTWQQHRLWTLPLLLFCKWFIYVSQLWIFIVIIATVANNYLLSCLIQSLKRFFIHPIRYLIRFVVIARGKLLEWIILGSSRTKFTNAISCESIVAYTTVVLKQKIVLSLLPKQSRKRFRIRIFSVLSPVIFYW